MKKVQYTFNVKCATLCFISFFIFHFSFSQTWQWGEHGNAWGLGKSIAADKEGNCYFGGYFVSQDTLIFSDSVLFNPYYNPYGFSYFIVKYNSSGNLLWARQSYNYGNFVNINGAIVASDVNNNIYIIATYNDTIILGNDTFNYPSFYKGPDFAVVKYNTAGNWLWASSPYLNSNDDSDAIAANYICTDNYGNTFVTGVYDADTVKFGSHYIFGNPINGLVFLIKYDSNGNALWVNTSSGHNSQANGSEAEYVTSDLKGNAYITGYFFDTVWFGSYRLTTFPSELFFLTSNLFLVKYSVGGTLIWAKQASLASAASTCQGQAVICDKSGNVYLAGNFVDTVTFDAYTLIGGGLAQNEYQQANLYLVKYDSGGNVLWAKQGTVLDSNSWGVSALSTDKYNHIFLSGGGGTHNCKIAFGTDTLSMFDTAVYDQSSILVKFDSNGNVMCSTIMGGGGHYTNSISSDSSGNQVYFGGCTSTVLAFGNDTINPFSYPTYSASGNNFLPFVARWDECGDITTATYSPAKEDMNAEVYPNPNNGGFTLSYQLQQGQKGEFTIYTMLGEMIAQYNLDANADKMNINAENLAEGIYIYKITVNNNIVKRDKIAIIK